MNKIVLWKPAWYELDQSVTVGDVDYYDIIRNVDILKFATMLETGEEIKLRVLNITNSEIGNIKKIDATGLSYKFYTDDNHYIQIEAEEKPGRIEQGFREKRLLKDTDFFVEVEVLQP